jgi:hypothetical protein
MARDKLSQKLAIVQTINPVSVSASTVNMTGISMAQHRKLMFILQTGVLGASATVDFKLQSSATSGGTYADISGKSITQLVKASNDNNQAVIEIQASELPAGQPFVRGVYTVGTAASILSGVVLGSNERYEPASDYNQAGVVQVVR